ncbi:DUF6542 domain-containing protein [Nocardioides sp.]|uniref:DUF6542 domain-containing protein n=1 Tax=Nocardioides sp. TaxID=35761 RepID=UPI0035162E04
MSLARSRTVWEEGRAPGVEMVALGAALTLTLAVTDLLLTERLGLIFDVAFVLLCVGLALAVHLHDSFTIGVLPPLLMLGVCLLFAVSERAAVARADDTVLQATVSGLSHHSGALALGYAAALGVLWVRHRVQRQRPA